MIKKVNILAAFEAVSLPPLDFVLPGLLSGTVGVLVAPGATGKSFWALEMLMSISCSVPGGDVAGLAPKHHGRVVYLAGEDPEVILMHRLNAISKHLSADARENIASNLEIITGCHLDVMTDDGYAELVSQALGTRLLVLDTLSRIHRLRENDNGDMSQVLSALEHVCEETGTTIIFLHHISKGSVREGGDKQQAGRGASSLVDNARWGAFLAKMTDEEAEILVRHDDPHKPVDKESFVRFGVNKINYAAFPEDVWYERQAGGVLLPVNLVSINQLSAEAKKDKQLVSKKSGKVQRIDFNGSELVEAGKWVQNG